MVFTKYKGYGMSTTIIYDEELAPLVIKNMPTEIHLNLGDDLYVDELNIDFNEREDVTWSTEKSTRTDIRYIREDETKYIGKKDIEGNKIYADSSIVEFEWAGYSGYTGIFIEDKQLMSIYIKLIKNPVGTSERRYWYNSYEDIKNLKIIDTIQENKLGLIK